MTIQTDYEEIEKQMIDTNADVYSYLELRRKTFITENLKSREEIIELCEIVLNMFDNDMSKDYEDEITGRLNKAKADKKFLEEKQNG